MNCGLVYEHKRQFHVKGKNNQDPVTGDPLPARGNTDPLGAPWDAFQTSDGRWLNLVMTRQEEIFDRLLVRMFRHPERRATQMVELSDLQAALTDPDDRTAFNRLAFPNRMRADTVEVRAVGDPAHSQVVVRSTIQDQHGHQYGADKHQAAVANDSLCECRREAVDGLEIRTHGSLSYIPVLVTICYRLVIN